MHTMTLTHQHEVGSPHSYIYWWLQLLTKYVKWCIKVHGMAITGYLVAMLDGLPQ